MLEHPLFDSLGFRLLLVVVGPLLLHNWANATSSPQPAVVIQWNSIALQGIRDAKLGASMVARALAVVHTCMYDAWAAYDERAVGTQLRDAIRRPASERTLSNKEQAVSYGAYRALVDVLPVDKNSVYIPLMKQLGYDPTDDSTDIETPAGIGNVACAAVLEFRHHDKSNQLGDLAQGAYSDYNGYRPVNPPGTVPARASFAGETVKSRTLAAAHLHRFCWRSRRSDVHGRAIVLRHSLRHVQRRRLPRFFSCGASRISSTDLPGLPGTSGGIGRNQRWAD